MITVEKLYQIVDSVAPFSLSDRFVQATGGYDNSGVIVRAGEQRSETVLFALDLSQAAIEKARQIGAKIIVTHHPAIWKGIERLDGSTPHDKAVSDCIAAGISVISAHLNADCAARGVDENLARGLGATQMHIHTDLGNGTGYGRTFDVPPQTVQEFCDTIKKTFDTQNVIVQGDVQKTVKRVSSFCGAGADDEAVEQAAGSDVIVSADFSHHVTLHAVARGLTVVHLTHYASENYGFRLLAKTIETQIGESAQCEYFTDRRLL